MGSKRVLAEEPDFLWAHSAKRKKELARPTLGKAASKRYKTGSLVRMKLKDFLTFDNSEFNFGARFNMVVAPNGNGKSSIVCAMLLGLCGQPKLLGRGDRVSDFVKHGKTEATIEIELAGRVDGRPGNTVVRREFNKDNKTSCFIDGVPKNQKDVKKIAEQMNIQIDNLTTFLPQDRVQDFSRMGPKELLRETQKAVSPADKNLCDLQDELAKLGAEENERKQEYEVQREKLEHLTNERDGLKKIVDRMNDKKKMEEKLGLMKKKLQLLEFQELQKKFREIKGLYEEKVKAVKQLEKDAGPAAEKMAKLEREQAKAIKSIEKLNGKNLKDVQASIKRENAELQKCTKKRDDLSEELENLDKDLENLVKGINKREADVLKTQKAVESVQQMSEETMQEELAAIDKTLKKELVPQLEELNKVIMNLEVQKKEIMSRVKSEEQKMKNALDVRTNRKNDVRRNDRNCADLQEWVASNQDKFKDRCFGPLAYYVEPKNSDLARYLDNAIPYSYKKSFITMNEHDQRILLDVCAQRNFQITIALVPPSGLNVEAPQHDWNLLKSKGIIGTLADGYDAPPIVKSYLNTHVNLNYHLYGSKTAEGHMKELSHSLNPKVQMYTNGHRYRTHVSNYGNRARTSEVVPLKDFNFIRCYSAQSEDAKAISQRINALKKELNQVDENLKSKLREKQALTDERKELLCKKQHINMSAKKKANALKALEESQAKLKRMKAQHKRDTEEYNKKKELVTDKLTRNAESFVSSVSEISRLLKEATEIRQVITTLKFRSEGVGAQAATLKSEYSEVTRRLQAAQAECKKLQQDVKEFREKTSRTLKEVEKMKDSLSEEGRQRIFGDDFSNDFQELDDDIRRLAAEIDAVHIDQHRIDRYKQLVEEVEELRVIVERAQTAMQNRDENIASRRNQWLTPLRDIIVRVNAKFEQYFEHIKCQGMVELIEPENKYNFMEYGIGINVRFRDTAKLQRLNARVQSGGERSFSTMVYLISLQDLAHCPFRVVDEINQGMDANNERQIMREVIMSSKDDLSPQYFVITPKLLPNMMHSEDMTTLFVFNGPEIIDQPSFNKCF